MAAPADNGGQQRIEIDPGKRFGKAVIRGTRIAVEEVVAQMAAGSDKSEVAAEFDITVEDVLAALEYAARAVANERRWAE